MLANFGMHIWTWASLKPMAYFCTPPVPYAHPRHWKSPLWKKNQLFFLPWREAQKKLCKGLEIMHYQLNYHNCKQNIPWEMWNTPSSFSFPFTHTLIHTQTQLQGIKKEELHIEKNQVQSVIFPPLLTFLFFFFPYSLLPLSSIRKERKVVYSSYQGEISRYLCGIHYVSKIIRQLIENSDLHKLSRSAIPLKSIELFGHKKEKIQTQGFQTQSERAQN